MLAKIIFIVFKTLFILTAVVLHVVLIQQTASECLKCVTQVTWFQICYQVRQRNLQEIVSECKETNTIWTYILTDTERLVIQIGFSIVYYSINVLCGFALYVEITAQAIHSMLTIVQVLKDR